MANEELKLTVLNNLIAHFRPLERPQWNRLTSWVRMLLGQQTSRANVEKALNNLQPYMSVEQLSGMGIDQLAELIHPVRFHDHKAEYIHNLVTWYVSQGGDQADFTNIPTEELRAELVKINGIGAETADTMLLYTLNRKVFIADRYAMLLFNRLKIGEYKSYEKMRQEFMPLTESASYDDVRDWHTAIDRYGRERNKQPVLNESWLLK